VLFLPCYIIVISSIYSYITNSILVKGKGDNMELRE